MVSGTEDARALARPEVDAETAVAREVVRLVEMLPVDSPQAFADATERVKAIKRRAEWWNDRRTSRVGPLTNVVRLLNADYRPASREYELAEGILKRKMAAYIDAQTHSRIAAMVQAAPVPVPAVETVQGVQTRAVRRFRVTNPDLVPRQFCSPDLGKIQEHVENGGLEAIAGVEFYTETTIAVRK